MFLAKLQKATNLMDCLVLTIPCANLPDASLPTQGAVFSFRGSLRKERLDEMLDPVRVFYGLGPNVGKVLIEVNLAEVEPVDGNQAVPEPSPATLEP